MATKTSPKCVKSGAGETCTYTRTGYTPAAKVACKPTEEKIGTKCYLKPVAGYKCKDGACSKFTQAVVPNFMDRIFEPSKWTPIEWIIVILLSVLIIYVIYKYYYETKTSIISIPIITPIAETSTTPSIIKQLFRTM